MVPIESNPLQPIKSRGYTDVIHVSQVNKKLLTIYCRAELLKSTPDLEGVNVSEDRIITSLIRYYLGLEYFKLKSQTENDLGKSR